MAETTIQPTEIATPTGTGVISRAGSTTSQLRRISNQPAVKRAMPAAAAIIVAFVGLISYLILQQPSRTTLYASLPQSEKSKII